jgi:simple sugar transport system permease protein
VIQLLETTLRSTSPILYVALAGTFAYRAGIFHLGLEGLMIIGAFTSVAVTIKAGGPWAGLFVAIGVCMAVSAIFWAVIVPLRANPIIAGIGLSLVGVGATSFALEKIFGSPGAIQAGRGLPEPIHGAHHGEVAGIFAQLSILVWISPLFVAASWLVLRRSRFGLYVAAVGEHPFAARSAGVSPARTRFWVLVIGGALCAIGGTDYALGGLQTFSENMTSGRGYIAFAAVLLGRGHPVGVAAASLFFGFANALAVQTQVWGTGGIPPAFVLMLPFVLTIVGVWLSGLAGRRGRELQAGFLELRE